MSAEKPPLMTYTWENVPRDLIERARAKLAAEQIPGQQPISLKWKLIELLRGWVDPAPKRGRPPKKG